MSTHEKALEKVRQRAYDSDEDDGTVSIFKASKSLLERHRDATSALNNAKNDLDTHASFQEARTKDRERVKDILVAGKRVFEREISGLRRDSKMVMPNEDEEVDAQAKAIFVGQRPQAKYGDVARSLKYVQKGVKKIVKGID